LSKEEIEKKIRLTRKAMEAAAIELDFLQAAQLRDEIKILQESL
jgi:excinuclease ABC subunit B